ncbi:MAG: CHAT domain-containing protein [Prochlorotrichaceae cyanobacterium]
MTLPISWDGTLAGTGDLQLQPLTTSQGIQLGGSDSGDPSLLTLTTAELVSLQDGFNSITIGRADGSGTIQGAANLNITDPLTLQAPGDSGAINLASFNLVGTDNASLNLQANQAITTGNLSTTNQAITVQSQEGRLTLGTLTTSGGAVTLSGAEDIQVSSINTQGILGGEIDVTTPQFFRSTNTFLATNGQAASLSSIGQDGGASITIRHGGNGVVPFLIGDAVTNGTAGSITSDRFSFLPPQSFLGSVTFGNLRILTQDPPEVSINLDLRGVGDDLNLRSHDTLTADLEAIDSVFAVLERQFFREFEEYLQLTDASFGQDFQNYQGSGDDVKSSRPSLAKAQRILRNIELISDHQPALVYVFFAPARPGLDRQMAPLEYETTLPNSDLDRLNVLLLPGNGKPIHVETDFTRLSLEPVVRSFRQQMTNLMSSPYQYLPTAQTLYDAIIRPIEPDLEQLGIEGLNFIMDSGLRSLPMAALHDGEKFLIEKYSISLMPSFGLTRLSQNNIQEEEVLAMGASTFTDLAPLPAVPLELKTVTEEVWVGQQFLNQSFTPENLRQQRELNSYGIVHLATHGEFKSGTLSDSYIQFSDQKVSLDELETLNLNDPGTDLLVLSACNTALGDRDAELGFAGLAVKAGVSSSLASLWYVSDEATFGLMGSFYQSLRGSRTKTEALRQAQLSMLRGEVYVQDGILVTSWNGRLELPPELDGGGGFWDFKHPVYWSAFTLIGSPW